MRKSLSATWKQGQGSYTCPLSMLTSNIFPKLLDILLFPHSSSTMTLLYLPTTVFFIQPFQGRSRFWSYSDWIFLVARGLEVGEFLPVPPRAVPQVCERTKFLSCRVMGAATKGTLERTYSLHSNLGEEMMLPNAPGCSAFTGLAVSCISFHPLLISFLFLLLLA